MPSASCEIPNEHPPLPHFEGEKVVHGIAMAGVTSILRQLGDLAQVAAEIFHDLHKEVVTIATRGHELLIRVQELEEEIPTLEKSLLIKSNRHFFNYTLGLEWHASSGLQQELFNQSDLPWFVRNSYKDCRGPPLLFLLDKFDVRGVGACLKRYTDPSCFKREWEHSKISKVQRENLESKAEGIKRNGHLQGRESIKVTSLQNMPPSFQSSSPDWKNIMGSLESLSSYGAPKITAVHNPIFIDVLVSEPIKLASEEEGRISDGNFKEEGIRGLFNTCKYNGNLELPQTKDDSSLEKMVKASDLLELSREFGEFGSNGELHSNMNSFSCNDDTISIDIFHFDLSRMGSTLVHMQGRSSMFLEGQTDTLEREDSELIIEPDMKSISTDAISNGFGPLYDIELEAQTDFDTAEDLRHHNPECLVVSQKTNEVIQEEFTSERSDNGKSLIQAISLHDKSMLKTVGHLNLPLKPKPLDEREKILEQIRTRSFTLRHSVVNKSGSLCLVPSAKVAAILEKANYLRQGLEGSNKDEESDSWSDA